jgi:hypothetical protein
MSWAARLFQTVVDRALATATAIARALAGVAALTCAACVDVNGGAVEVSWALFARDGRAINDCSCADPAIGYVRLQLVSETDPTNQPCAGNSACRFACGRKTGATPFFIAPGQYLMSVVPVGADGSDLPTMFTSENVVPSVQAPAAESRTVVGGQPTELEAFMLEADCSSTCNAGGISSPCTGG